VVDERFVYSGIVVQDRISSVARTSMGWPQGVVAGTGVVRHQSKVWATAGSPATKSCRIEDHG
jgi:hypothetical protein